MSQNISSRDDVVILAGARTPKGRLNGQLAAFTAVELGGKAIAAAWTRGSPQTGGRGHHGAGAAGRSRPEPGPAGSIGAGLGWNVPTVTINKVCLSGLTAVIDAARMIRSGDAARGGGRRPGVHDQRAPHLLPGSRQGWTYGACPGPRCRRPRRPHGCLRRPVHGPVHRDARTHPGHRPDGAGRGGRRVAPARGRGREETASSTARSSPISVQQRKGDPVVVTTTKASGRTPRSNPGRRCARRSPRTAPSPPATPLPLSDGAAALVLTTRKFAEDNGLDYLAVVGKPGQVAGPDNSLHSQPSNAIRNALERAGWTTADLDFIEINEAFGSVAVQSLKDLDYPLEQCNIHGGAIALGHPIGASGARLALHAAHELKRRGHRQGRRVAVRRRRPGRSAAAVPRLMRALSARNGRGTARRAGSASWPTPPPAASTSRSWSGSRRTAWRRRPRILGISRRTS